MIDIKSVQKDKMDNNKKSVLVIEVGTQIGLSVIQSLARHGIPVYALARKKSDIGLYSKYLTKGFVADKFGDNPEFIEALIRILKNNEIGHIMAISEFMLLTLNKYRDAIEKHAKLLIPGKEILNLALDKDKTTTIADELGIPIPKIINISNPADIDAHKDLLFPLVIKPSVRFNDKFVSRHDFRIKFIFNRDDLAKEITELNNKKNPFMVQEYCGDKEIGFGILMKQSDCLACFQYKILRNSPTHGGVPVYRESTEIDPSLKDYSIRLLRAIKWEGPAEIDYIYDQRDKKTKFLEVNGRFWGSLPLAVKAGVEFPYLLYSANQNGEKMIINRYKVGLKCRLLGGDTRWLVDILLSKYKFNDQLYKISKIKALFEYFKAFAPSVKCDTLSLSDPMPGIIDIWSMIRKPFIRQ